MPYRNRLITIFWAAALLLATGCHQQPHPAIDHRQLRQTDSLLATVHDADSLQQLTDSFAAAGNRLGQCLGLKALGKCYRDRSNFEQAIECHEQAVQLALELRDTLAQVEALNNLATDYRRLGLLDLAAECHYTAYNLCLQFSDQSSEQARKNRTVTLNGAGNVYLQLGNTSMADSLFRLALDTERQLGSALGMAINYANLGAMFEECNQLDSARIYYQHSYEQNRQAHSQLGMALCHLHYGRIDEKQGRTAQARAEYTEAYHELDRLGDTWHWLDACLALAKLEGARPGSTSNPYLDQALDRATAIHSKEHLEAAHRLYYEIAQQQANTAGALVHFKLAEAYADSLINLHTLSQLQNMRIGLEHRRSEQQLELVRENLKLEHQQKLAGYVVLGSLLAVVLLVLVLLIYITRAREQQRRNEKMLQQVREQFFTNVTHEFRTPLSVILGAVDQLKATPSPALAAIERNSNQLLQLINRLLDISKVKYAIAQAEWFRGNLAGFTQMVVESHRPMTEAKHVTLTCTTVPQGDIEADFIPDYYEKILGNLLSNACKFTPEGGHIAVELQAEDNRRLRLSVSDTGIGMSETVLEHLFEPFYQAPTDTENIGTGIGLTLTKQMVKAMEGEISASSQPGQGSRFVITLPQKNDSKPHPRLNLENYPAVPSASDHAAPAAPPVSPAAPPVATLPDGEQPTVLVVEDNADVAAYVGQLLGKDYGVVYAANGDEGLKRAQQLVPDVIVTDIMMPGTSSGLDLCRHVRSSALLNHIPLVVVTAKASDADRLQAIEAGADAYLLKPFRADELQAWVEKLLEQRRLLSEKYAQAMSNGPTDGTSPAALENDFLQRLQSAAQQLMQERRFDAESLAGLMCVSRPQLNRKIQAMTGMTTTAFMGSYRMTHAKQLLDLHPDMAVSEVALRCGFEDVAYFSRCFKQATQLTPTQYRRRETAQPAASASATTGKGRS